MKLIGKLQKLNINLMQNKIFISKTIPNKIKEELLDNNFHCIIIAEEEDFLSILTGSEIVVLDHYDLDSNYQKEIKEIGCKLVCIDDLHNKKFYADLIINHSPGILENDYDAQDYTKYALGIEFALLRPIFLKAARIERSVENIENLLICFGGSDFKNLTKPVLEVVKNINLFKKVTVILGAAYPYRKSLEEVTKQIPNIRILSSLDENAMLCEIQDADLAIIPSSGILLEVIAGGSIPLICYYAENQKKLFNYFKKNSTISSFNALDFNSDELNTILLNIVNGKIAVKKHPFREKIKESQVNNLNNFKNLLNDRY